MADGVNTGPNFIAPLGADPTGGVNATPTFVPPLAADPTPGVAAIPAFISPALQDNHASADSPTPVEPLDLAGSLSGGNDTAPLSLHEAIALPRNGAAVPMRAAQGVRVQGNLFHTLTSKGYADTSGYTLAIFDPGDVQASRPVIQGGNSPRARVRGMGGGPY